jgi:hypothetical protein
LKSTTPAPLTKRLNFILMCVCLLLIAAALWRWQAHIKLGGEINECLSGHHDAHSQTIEFNMISGLWVVLAACVVVCFVLIIIHNLQKDPGQRAAVQRLVNSISGSLTGSAGVQRLSGGSSMMTHSLNMAGSASVLQTGQQSQSTTSGQLSQFESAAAAAAGGGQGQVSGGDSSKFEGHSTITRSMAALRQPSIFFSNIVQHMDSFTSRRPSAAHGQDPRLSQQTAGDSAKPQSKWRTLIVGVPSSG